MHSCSMLYTSHWQLLAFQWISPLAGAFFPMDFTSSTVKESCIALLILSGQASKFCPEKSLNITASIEGAW